MLLSFHKGVLQSQIYVALGQACYLMRGTHFNTRVLHLLSDLLALVIKEGTHGRTVHPKIERCCVNQAFANWVSHVH